MLRQLLADFHHLVGQLSHRKAVLCFLGRREIKIENVIQGSNKAVDRFAMFAQPLGHRQRRRGFRAELLHAGRHQLAEQIQLQAEPWRGDFGAHFQRIPRHIGQMVAFIEHQQQVFGLRQDGLTLQRGHDQRVVSDNHLRFLNLPPCDKERALAVVVAVAVKATGFIGAEPAPQIIADGMAGVIAKAVPLVAVELGF